MHDYKDPPLGHGREIEEPRWYNILYGIYASRGEQPLPSYFAVESMPEMVGVGRLRVLACLLDMGSLYLRVRSLYWLVFEKAVRFQLHSRIQCPGR